MTQHIKALVHWCLRLYPLGWEIVRYFWGIFFLALLPNAIIALLFLSRGTSLQSLYLWPIIEWIWQNHFFSGITLLFFIALTIMLWRENRNNKNAENQENLLSMNVVNKNYNIFVHALQKEYDRQLEQSLHGMTIIPLGFNERTDAIHSPNQLIFQRTSSTEKYPLQFGTSIAQVFDNAGYGLLIIGEPGAGKTILLLNLARELLIRTQTQSDQPIPVILNLASWGNKKNTFTEWLIDQLQLNYQVPRRLSKIWIQNGRLLLLLDGLDEAKEAARISCIEAINDYREEHFTPLIVCSRSQEYFALAKKLALSTAIEVQPLRKLQVTKYLQHIGKPVAAVRAALRSNPVLFELITNPLMLQIVVLTYRGKTVKDLPQMDSSEEQKQQIFTRYIKRMLERKGNNEVEHYSYDQTVCYLCYLAQQMKHNSLTVFYIERMQPDMLADNPSRNTYQIIERLFGGINYGLTFGLLFGSLVSLIIRIMYGVTQYTLYGDIASGLIPGLIFFCLANWLPDKMFTTHEIRPIESVSYKIVKNHSLKTAILLCLLLYIFFFIIIFVLHSFNFSAFIYLIWAPIILLYLRYKLETSKGMLHEDKLIRPNEGIRRSAINSVIYGLLVGIIMGIIAYIFGGLLSGIIFGLGFILIGALANGGDPFIRHYILRWILWQNGNIPYNYSKFLDYAAEHILLQKIGGGYSFIHPLLLDHFVMLNTQANCQKQKEKSM